MQTSGYPLCSLREIPPLPGSLEPEQHLSRQGPPVRQRKLRDKAMKAHFSPNFLKAQFFQDVCEA
jgi:hypothetical protein